jgi:hypothetical protein
LIHWESLFDQSKDWKDRWLKASIKIWLSERLPVTALPHAAPTINAWACHLLTNPAVE